MPSIPAPTVAAVLIAIGLLQSPTQAGAQSAQAMAQNCFVCHGPGAKGSGPIVGLAGQPKELIDQQLVAFKADRRIGTIMNRIAKGYSDEQIAAIADHLSKLPK